jgi:hypothetical protein
MVALPPVLRVVLLAGGSRLADARSSSGIWLPLKLASPALLLVYLWRAGSYPELRGYSPSACALLSDVGVGVGIAVMWVAPVMLWDVLPRPAPTEGFDSGVYGSAAAAAALAIRGMGFFAETPFVEELFVRSFLLRFVDVFKSGADFRSVPIARYTRLNFWFTIGWFTFSHATWSTGSLSRPESCSTSGSTAGAI